MELHYSAVESRRFGLRVFRCAAAALDRASLLASLLEHSADLVILRLPADALAERVDFEQVGVPIVVADTLVHYTADLEKLRPGAPRNSDLRFVAAEAATLEELVRRAFGKYVSHYRANPILPMEALVEGYVEWARGFAAGDPARRAWVAWTGDVPAAFATCRFAGEEMDGVLYGVSPSQTGRGVYRDLIRFTMAQGREHGCRLMHVSTQESNVAVQGVWASEGLRLRRAEVTVHLNPLLDWPRHGSREVERVWSRQDREDGRPWAARRLVEALAADFLEEAHPRLPAPRVTRHLEVGPLPAGEPCRVWFRVLEMPRIRLAVLQVADAAARVVHQVYCHLPGRVEIESAAG